MRIFCIIPLQKITSMNFPDNSRQIKFALLRNGAFQRRLTNRCFNLYLRGQYALFDKQSEMILPGSIPGRVAILNDSATSRENSRSGSRFFSQHEQSPDGSPVLQIAPATCDQCHHISRTGSWFHKHRFRQAQCCKPPIETVGKINSQRWKHKLNPPKTRALGPGIE